MKIEQNALKDSSFENFAAKDLGDSASLALVFGGSKILKKAGIFDKIRNSYPKAYIAGCSTSGEINGVVVEDETVSLTAVAFENAEVRGSHFEVEHIEASFTAGERLAESLDDSGLRHVLVFSDGLKVNGTRLALGLKSKLPPDVGISGGLAGDGDRFEETLVMTNQPPRPGCVVALGFYGEGLNIGCSSVGGWIPFGPERVID